MRENFITQLPHYKIVDREIVRFLEISFKMYYRLLSVPNSVIANISEFEIATCGTWVITGHTAPAFRMSQRGQKSMGEVMTTLQKQRPY